MKNQTQKTTLHQTYLQGTNSRDIADNIFDFANCFEVSELDTSANNGNIDDNYNNCLLWFADNIETTGADNNYIHCNITQFIEQNRAIFDKFLNQVYKPEYQPRNNEPIEPESEEFYDFYLDAFAGLINGTFSDNDYTILWRIICENRANKSTLKTMCKKMEKMSREIDALHYARMLTSDKHNNAFDMVQNVPNNVYIEEWKRTEKDLAKKCEYLEQLENDLQKELYDLCDAIEQERNEQRKALDNYFIGNLSSAYQENAIYNAIEDFNESETMTAQDFADACCEYYREQLKSAGYKDNIYKGFKDHGDECQVQSVALAIYGIITR